MHYTNPEGATNIFDSSGASLGVTTKLRQYDSDIMMTGPVIYDPLIRIPPFRVREANAGVRSFIPYPYSPANKLRLC